MAALSRHLAVYSATPSPRGSAPKTPFPCHPEAKPKDPDLFFLTNLSLDVNIPSLADSLCSTVRSGSPHLGQKTNKMALVNKRFVIRDVLYW